MTIELGSVWPYLYLAHGYDVKPRYVVYGGLVFQPLSLDLIDAYAPTDVRIRHYFDYFVIEQIYLEHPEVVILTNILPDPTNTYLSAYRASIVDEVNGKKIRKLDDLAAAFAETGGSIRGPDDWRRAAARARPERSGIGAGANQDPLQRGRRTEPRRTAEQADSG